MSSDLQKQRTYALIGAGGAGKTSIGEMLLFQAGIINRLGLIEEGTSVLDYEPEEIKRRGSIQAGFANFTYDGHEHFLIDIPGDSNFNGDMEYLLKGVDGAVLIIDAIDGVRPQTRTLWQHIKKRSLPSFVFINKMDRERANFDMAYNGLLSSLGMKPVVFYMPIIENEEFLGLVDIFAAKALYFAENGETIEKTIPDDLADEAQLLRDTSIENIAESNEILMNKYLEEGMLSEADMEMGLRQGVLAGDIVPVVVGSSLANKGGRRLLSLINKLFPSPLDGKEFLNCDGQSLCADAPATVYIFKTLHDAFAGQISMARVISGTISPDSTLKNARSGDTERLGSLVYVCGKNQTPCKNILSAGAIIGITKLKNTITGDTLHDEKVPCCIENPVLAPQLITFALAPEVKGEEDKVFAAVQKLVAEDITLKLARDEETGDTLLSGMGQLHIEISVEKARRRSKVEIALKTPKIPYRETIRGTCKVQGRHKKQSGGRGQFGDCWIELEGLPRGEGYKFEDAIVGGSIPKQYIPAIDKGIQESALRGFIAGYPIVDFKVRLYDGSYHNVDSSEMAFKLAGSAAFKNALENVNVILLEPIALVTVYIPDAYMGDVIGDLSSRRGKVLGSDSVQGVTEIKAHVPTNEILRYAPDLRSMTSGQGVFTMEFDHYEEAPPPVVEKITAEYQKFAK